MSALVDLLGADYQRMIDWDRRLGNELPFLLRRLPAPPADILDIGSGTGEHAVALAGRGFSVTGVEPFEDFHRAATAKGGGLEPPPTFCNQDFDEWYSGNEKLFDGVICLGNTVGLLGETSSLDEILRRFGTILRPGGHLVIQAIDTAVLPVGESIDIPLKSFRSDSGGWVLVSRSYIRLEGGALLKITVVREEPSGWEQRCASVSFPLVGAENLLQTLSRVGFSSIELFADVKGTRRVSGKAGSFWLAARIPAQKQPR